MMGNHPLVRFYNPRDLTRETLERLFTGRDHLIEQILEDLRRQSTSRSRQHWLVQGPRGFGKTHLMSLVYHRAGADEALSQAYLPVWLGEAESYGCYSVGTFMLCVAERFGEELRARNDSGLASFDEKLRAISSGGDEPLLVEEITDLLRAEGTARRKNLLIIVENFDALLGGFSKHSGASQVKSLRALLSHEQRLLFLMTTATSELRAVSDPGEPLFGLLRPLKLEPFDEMGTVDLFQRVADVVGMPEHREALSEATEDGRLRRRVLHRLTGGNPRAIVMAFFVVKGGQGVEEIVKELTALLDVHTAYFEARLSQCAPRERSILTAVCLASTNLTMQEIAAKTRLPERSLSTQVDRLVRDGHLMRAEGSTGKGALYEVADGLFRLWYQYRKGCALLEPIVRFLALWYPPRELEEASHSLAKEAHDEAIPAIRRDMAWKAFAHVEAARRLSASPAIASERALLWSLPTAEERPDHIPTGANESSRAHCEGDDEGQRPELCDDGDAVVDTLSPPTDVAGKRGGAGAFVNKRLTLGTRSRVDAKLASCDEVIRRFGERTEAALLVRIAAAFLDKGVSLRELGRADEAIVAYDELIRRFGERTEAPLLGSVAVAFVEKGIALRKLARADEAIVAYDEVTRRFAERTEVEILKPIARALVNKCLALSALNSTDEAIAAYDRVVCCFAERTEAILLEAVARALVGKGVLCRNIGRVNEAIDAYDEVIRRFAGRTEAALLERVAEALVSKGIVLASLKRVDEAITAYDQVVLRFADRTETTFLALTARALVNKGLTLGTVSRVEQEIAAYDEVVARFAQRTEMAVLAVVVRALVTKGVVLGRLDRADEALVACDDVVRRCEGRTETVLLEAVARALVNKGVTLRKLNRVDEAVAVYDDVVHRYEGQTQAVLLEGVARALVNKGAILGSLNRVDEAVTVYDDVVHRCKGRTETSLLEAVARALVSKGSALRRLNHVDEAVAIYDDVVSRFADHPEADLLEHVAAALVYKGFALSTLNRADEELAAYDEVIRRFADRTEADLLEPVARALVTKGLALRRLNRVDEEAAAYEEAIRRFAESSHAGIRKLVAIALLFKGWLLEERRSFVQALACFQEIDRRVGEAELEIESIVAEARLRAALLLSRQGNILEAERTRARWIDSLRSLRQSDHFADGLRRILCVLHIETARDWLGALSKAGLRKDLAQLAEFCTLVADVLESGEPRHAGGRQERGPSERRRRSLARVPATLRETVREWADAISAERSRLKVDAAPTSEGGATPRDD